MVWPNLGSRTAIEHKNGCCPAHFRSIRSGVSGPGEPGFRPDRLGCQGNGLARSDQLVRSTLYASNAWWGFSNANDRQKIFAFIHRCIRTGFRSPDLADFHDLYISSDQKLFSKISTCPNHILRSLLPPSTAQNYSLRNRPHNRQLPDRISRITDCIFTGRMLYRNMY